MTSIGILGSVGFSCAESNANGCSFALDLVLILGRGFPIAFFLLSILILESILYLDGLVGRGWS
jgi:hypothetical protein